jgi:hypothetical protein
VKDSPFLSGFQVYWPPSCCLYLATPFMGSNERAVYPEPCVKVSPPPSQLGTGTFQIRTPAAFNQQQVHPQLACLESFIGTTRHARVTPLPTLFYRLEAVHLGAKQPNWLNL